MNKQLLLILSAFLLAVSAYAQEALFRAQNIISPEIHEDNSVTFRLFAPNAKSVQVTGDFLPTVKMDTPMGQMDGPGKAELTKDEKIKLALEELSAIVMGGQDGEEFYNSVKFIKDVLESFK